MYNLIRLKNGLRVVIESIDYVNSVTVGLWIENGSRNENKLNNGISHFIEHMLFKGTENRSSKNIVESIEDVGGQINAFTGKEATCFYIKTLDTHLELGLDLLSDMLFNSKFSEEEIEKEKNVVIEEIKMNNDNPEDVLMDLYSKAAFAEDSLALPILGTINTVKSFNRNMLKEYVNSYYIPENSVISISGKVDVNTIERLIEKYFGQWKTSNKRITKYSNPQIRNNHLFLQKNIEQLHINLGFRGLELGDENVYALMLINTYLGGGASSILFQKIREELGMCYTIYSYISSFVNGGLVNIYTGLNPKCAVDAINYIREELDDFSHKITNINNEKITKLKEQLKGNFILGLESTSSRMFRNGRIALFFNNIITPEEVIKKIDAINKNQITDVIEKTFSHGIENSAFVGDNYNDKKILIALEEDIVAYRNPKRVNL
ncbi:MAG: pitrilysin family protein [Clostridium sp.]|nr:pitrilysin family protein [Clostridium sp.]